MTALALDGTSPLDLGAVTEVFGIDRGLAPQWYDFSVCGQRRGRLDTRGGLRLTVDRGLDELAVADTIIVLPVARFIRERPADVVLAALAAASARGIPVMNSRPSSWCRKISMRRGRPERRPVVVRSTIWLWRNAARSARLHRRH